MSDVMLLGVLRMPLDYVGAPLSPLAQFVARAREAADRIESDAAEIARLRAVMEALRGLLRAIPTDSDMAEGMTADQIKEVCDAYDTARAAIDAARTEGIKP